jgi:hypothetical protein
LVKTKANSLIGEFPVRSITLALLTLLVMPAQAALVDNNSYTTDTATGLDWLDIDLTSGMTLAEAEAANSGWQLASNSEVDDLFAKTFPSYVGQLRHNPAFPEDWYEYEGLVCSPDCGSELYDSAVEFANLFGQVTTQTHFSNGYGTGALYTDEDGILRQLGWSVEPTGCTSYRCSGGNFYVFGPEYTRVLSEDFSYTAGVFLVRTTAVPVPAAVWLFGSALAGLGWLRRKQVV